MSGGWHQTACILCNINCGIEVKLDGRRFVRVRGDKAHPASQGYTCEKALRLDHYQNGSDRLSSPLRRRSDGTYEKIDWDTAIAEVAAGLADIRDNHGGESIFYYGGGSQANHLGGGFASATRRALGSRYSSNALAQEKTGEFWVDGQLYGALRCHTTPDMHNTDCAVFLGKNPWQSHGFPRARVVLKEIANDPQRTMIVIDPRRTETAELADHHLQLRPGTDAWCLGAMLKILIDDDLIDRAWLDQHANRLDELTDLLASVDIDSWCERAGLDVADVRAATHAIGTAASGAVFEDLGIQMAPHSTLNSWLEKLLYLLTGNFATKGGMNIHSRFGSLGGGGGGGGATRTSPVGGHRIIGGLIPCNAIPEEILTEHPDRFRAAIVESANPIHSLADSRRMREAFDALDMVVVIDVAMTETARCADYVLPASSQYEKWEAAFFTLEFPDNDFHLRAPILEPLTGTLPEPEIHRRLVRALGAYTDDDIAGLRSAADAGLDAFGREFLETLTARPHLNAFLPVVLLETLGPTLGAGAEATAAIWGLAQTCAGFEPEAVRRAGAEGDGLALGNALFDKIRSASTAVVFTTDPYDATWDRMATIDKRVNLVVDDLVDEFRGLADEQPITSDEFPYILSAGERRSGTANTAMRDPEWRRKNPGTALRMSPGDATVLGVADGGRVRVITKRGTAEVTVEITDSLQPGHISLPNGQGVSYPDLDDSIDVGVAPNELTASEDRDWLAGTPWHKHVRARLEPVA